MSPRIITALFLALVFTTYPAAAKEIPDFAGVMAYDRDGDQMLSEAEQKEFLKAKGQRSASDIKKLWSLTEAYVIARPMQEKIFAAADSNRDGKLTKIEYARTFPKAEERRIDRMFPDAKPLSRAQFLDAMGGDMLRQIEKMPGGSAYLRARMDYREDNKTDLKKYDSDKNGIVSPAELTEKGRDDFRSLPMAKDGAITINEYTGWQQRLSYPSSGKFSKPSEVRGKFNEIDTDRDGKIIRDEYARHHTDNTLAMFSKIFRRDLSWGVPVGKPKKR